MSDQQRKPAQQNSFSAFDNTNNNNNNAPKVAAPNPFDWPTNPTNIAPKATAAPSNAWDMQGLKSPEQILGGSSRSTHGNFLKYNILKEFYALFLIL